MRTNVDIFYKVTSLDELKEVLNFLDTYNQSKKREQTRLRVAKHRQRKRKHHET